MRRSTSSVSRDCAPWALSDPTWRWQRFYSGSQDTEVRKRNPVLRKAQDPPVSHGGIDIVRIFPMPTQVITDDRGLGSIPSHLQSRNSTY